VAQQTYTTAAGTAISKPLPFPARTALISNNSSAWCSVPGNGWPIPPWQNGVVLPLAATTQTASLAWGPPAGILPIPIDTSQGLVGIWTDHDLPFDPGRPTQTTGNAAILLLPVGSNNSKWSVPAGTTVTQNYAIPQGIDAIFVMTDDDLQFVSTVEVVSAVTAGYIYGQSGPQFNTGSGNSWFMFPVQPSLDPLVTVSVTSSASSSGPTHVQVLAITHPVVTLTEIIGNQTPLTVVTPLNVPLLTNATGQTPAMVVSSTNANASIVITGSIGLATRIHTITTSYDSPNSGGFVQTLVGGSGVWQANFEANQLYPQHFVFPEGGMQPTSAGGNCTVTIGAGGAGVKGILSLTYTQE
jgi:hypothetical protein